jgi:hypothetical protein
MSILLELEAELLDYAKSMPEAGKAEVEDFEVWGKGFCEWMVSRDYFDLFLAYFGTIARI